MPGRSWGNAGRGLSAPWLAAITLGYLVWSLGPLLLAVVYSFNDAPSVTHWEGLSLRWWIGEPAAEESLVYDPETRAALRHSLLLATWATVISVPIASAFAIGCRGWSARLPRIGLGAMFIALALPPIVLAAAMRLVFVFPLRRVPFGDLGWFGTRAQIVGLVTLLMPLATLVEWARLSLLDRNHEESAADLGAPPNDVVRRVILPQVGPAIGAAAAVVFAGALGEFVMVQMLVGTNDTRALAPELFGALEGAEPVHSVIGTVLAVVGLAAFTIVALVFRATVRRVER